MKRFLFLTIKKICLPLEKGDARRAEGFDNPSSSNPPCPPFPKGDKIKIIFQSGKGMFFVFLFSLFFLLSANHAHAATEFVSIVDTGAASDSDYSSLSTWETAIGTNLTAPSTLVFTGIVTGTAPIDGSSVTLYRSGASTGVGATVVHTAKTNTKILLKNVSNPAYGFTTGDEWRINATNLFTIDATVPDQPQVTAKCRATTGTADTTAVTINGWDTDATHYIKIWTDPSENYRHQGKWDTGKYRIEGNVYISVNENYVTVDGLQILANISANYRVLLVADAVPTSNSEIKFSNNIIRANPTSTYNRGIGLRGGAVVKVWNNIIYGFNAASNYGIELELNGITLYLYNNTVVNNTTGINAYYGTLIAKNNLFYNNTDNCGSGFNGNSTNNLSGPSSDAQLNSTTAPQNGVTVTFADSTNNDFHLDSSDTGAKNYGILLNDSGDDANLYFTTDVDNEARKDSAGTWDIGADENVAKIYRSVGAGATSPLAWGGTADSSYGNMTISGLIATFWRPLPDNVGVGDALQYDADNTGGIDKIVFITKRIDSTHYSVRKSDGTAPDATTSLPNSGWGIYRSYISLNNAYAGTENTGIADAVENFDTFSSSKDLTINNEQWNIACYGTGTSDTTAVYLSNWTSSVDDYLRIYTPTRLDEVGTSQRHAGKWDANKYNLSVSTGYALREALNYYAKIDGLQVYSGDSGAVRFYNITGSGSATLSNSIIKGNSSNYNRVVAADSIGGSFKLYIFNNIIYDGSGLEVAGIFISEANITAYVYNNTITGNTEGIKISAGTAIAKNNIVKGSGDTYSYYGTFSTGTDYNSTDANDDIGTGSNNRKSQTFTFADATNKDFHLAPGDAGARNYGADLTNDLYLPINSDIDSTGVPSGTKDAINCVSTDDACLTRPRATSWDIGADELITKIYRSVGVGTTAAIISGTSPAISLTISGNTGTFATWPTSADFGVGDVIRYDSDNNGTLDSTAFISAIDSTAKTATLQSGTGGAPTAMAVGDYDWKLFRAHTSLSAWESGTANTGIGVTFPGGDRDIATNSEQWNVSCYANSGTAPDTTGVTISGWTTAQQNYIKVYTPTSTSEVTTSQRHQGKWDGTKYKHEYTNNYNFTISGNFVRLEGIQMKRTTGNGNGAAIYMSNIAAGGSNVVINSCILWDVSSSNAQPIGILVEDADAIARIYNNIFQDVRNDTMSYGVGINGSGTATYAYNNTFYNCYRAINGNINTYAKNNIAQNSTDSFYTTTTFNPSSDYNISNIAADTTGGTHDKASTTVSFVDATNKDYHLATTDTSAKDAGADLSQDLYLPITSDIDGQSRPICRDALQCVSTSVPDIGADESATAIYRSLAPSATSAIASGTSPANSMIIAGTSVTFGTAPGDTIGVGDAIQYDSDNNGTVDSIAFISGRTSGTVYTIQDRTGGTPTSTSATDYDWSIFRAYTSLQNATGSSTGGTENTGLADAVEHFDIGWSAAHGKDIYKYNQQWNVAAYANGTTADSTATTISGWTTYPTNYLKIYTPTATTEVGTSQRSQGKKDSSKYNLVPGATSDGIDNYVNNIRIDGLAIGGTNWNVVARRAAFRNYASGLNDVQISNCIMYDLYNAGGSYAFGYYSGTNATGTVKIWNNLIYTSSTVSGDYGISPGYSASGKKYYIYNNTIYGIYYGIYGSVSSSFTYADIKNNLVQGGNTNYTSSSNFGTHSNNISSDATSPDSGGTDCGTHSCRSQTVVFADAANKDFHLASSDTSARNSGADLSADAYLPVTTDIDGHTRPTGTNMVDIGADEGATAIYYSVGQSTSTDFKVASNVSVSGYTATFTTAQTGNIGVGDIVTYTGGSCNITGKTSTSVWSCSNVTGGTAPQVSTVAVSSIKRAFASLSSAMSGSTAPQFLNTTDLKTNNYQLNIPCYMDSGTQPDTTAVTIQGYTTAVPNYIKVYTPNNTTTEANNSQRHQGKWTTSAYTIARSWGQGITIDNDYVKVDGIQIDNTGSANQGVLTYNKVEISNCIIRNMAYGLYLAGIENKIYNNIIYGATTQGMRLALYNSSVYNNTLINNAVGIQKICISNVLAKNNLFSGNTSDYTNGGCAEDVNFTYTATNQASGIPAGTGNRYGQTFTFADATNYDYHLAQSDAAAKNYGTDLSADTSFAFTSDIDGNTRNLNSRGWDIGADEAATAIYYSVGQSSSDLKTGSPTLSIDSSGNGTLSVAQTGNMGVGDYIEYGTSPYVKAYITGKTSTTVWTVQSATGSSLGVGTTMPVNSIKHSYTTLSGAIAGASGATMMNATDLYTNNYQLNVPCYYDNAADTTATTISGYTTYSMNYIKVYTPTSTTTEANNSQRHSGKWDDGKYRLEISSDASTMNVLLPNVIIDGLQLVSTTYARNYSYGIFIYNNSPVSLPIRVTIKNNIVKSGNFSTRYSVGIVTSAASRSPNYFQNNIVYGFSGQDNACIWINGDYGARYENYVYNNTVYNCKTGIGGESATAKNNIAQNCTDGYYFWGTNQDYNISDLAGDAFGAHSKNSTTVAFVDSANYDFHLAESDSSARNAGADLSADTNLSFSTDIDGHSRSVSPANAGWDIGADESAIYIYYSVGQNTSDHKTLGVGGSAPTITLSGYSATLSVGQTAPNMGVGDLITYTGGSCFITSKTNDDKMHWNCQNATGGTAPQVTTQSVTTITHAFDSLSTAISNGNNAVANSSHLNTTNLYTGNYALSIPCYYDSGADATAITIYGLTTAQNNYIKVYTPNNTSTEVNQTQRHSGKWDDTKYRLDGSNTGNVGMIYIGSGYYKIQGLQIRNTGASAAQGVRVSATDTSEVYFGENILLGNSNSNVMAFWISAVGINSKAMIWNNIIYDWTGTAAQGLYIGDSDETAYVYNNTLVGNTGGIKVSLATTIAKNNIVKGSGNSWTYEGTFAASTDYNATDGTDAIGQGTHNRISQTFNFADEANKDFHLTANDTSALGKGIKLASYSDDPVLNFTTDIDGQTRGGWCIGADEFSEINEVIKGTVRTKGTVKFK
jgi:hypothetical protein